MVRGKGSMRDKKKVRTNTLLFHQQSRAVGQGNAVVFHITLFEKSSWKGPCKMFSLGLERVQSLDQDKDRKQEER